MTNKFILNNHKYKNLAYLIVNRSSSNIFVTLTDLNKQVIICKSSGQCSLNNTKKNKKAPQILENIIDQLIDKIELYQLKYFHIILKVRFSSHIVILIKELVDRGYNIIQLNNNLKIGHNGMRGRKLRRI